MGYDFTALAKKVLFPRGFHLSSQAHGVVNLDEKIQDSVIVAGSVACTVAWKLLYTVPAEERWHCLSIYGSGSGALSRYTSLALVGNESLFHVFYTFTAANDFLYFFPSEILAEPGWLIKVNCTVQGAPDTCNATLLIRRELIK